MFVFKAGLICLSLMTITFCNKEQSFESKGQITGRDYRKCACRDEKCGCCGHWVIDIDDQTYIFTELPKTPKFDLNENKTFPIPISLDWRVDPDSCAAAWGYIIVDRFEVD